MDKKEINFLRQKEYRFIKDLGRGGLGQAILIEDEIIDERFVCKKYCPLYDEHKEIYFKNFIQEIKLLHLLNHQHIVRVFNYYLYPEKHTGYILMEFVDGENIYDYLASYPDKVNEIFEQTIKGFLHLENINILHRDIRPQNILITTNGIVKIIDFGFGKQINFQDDDFDKSISLNWRYSPPSEFSQKVYDFRTELYFVASLFNELISELNLHSFRYQNVLDKMLRPMYDDRIMSFFEIERCILKNEFATIKFSEYDKVVYQKFVAEVVKIFASIENGSEYISSIEQILQGLENAQLNSFLENHIHNNLLIARVFIKGTYKYYKHTNFPTLYLNNFIEFLKSLSKEKQRIVLNNMWQRFDSIERTEPNAVDDLPF